MTPVAQLLGPEEKNNIILKLLSIVGWCSAVFKAKLKRCSVFNYATGRGRALFI